MEDQGIRRRVVGEIVSGRGRDRGGSKGVRLYGDGEKLNFW